MTIVEFLIVGSVTLSLVALRIGIPLAVTWGVGRVLR
jgi:hypothetical protein